MKIVKCHHTNCYRRQIYKGRKAGGSNPYSNYEDRYQAVNSISMISKELENVSKFGKITFINLGQHLDTKMALSLWNNETLRRQI